MQGEAIDVDLKEQSEGVHLCFDTTWSCMENGLDVDNGETKATSYATAACLVKDAVSC